MLNKKLLTATTAAVLLTGAAGAMAEVEISGNVALTSDYRFRGISQSNDDIAVQGGFDLSFGPGFYVGTWGSTVDFLTAEGEGVDGSLELDYYAGWSMETESGVGVDVGYLYYDYPGDDGLEGDYQEIYGSVSFWDVTLGAAYSDDYYAETGEFYYYYADYSLGLGDNLSLDLHVGYNDVEDGGGYLSTDKDGFVDYSVGLTASYWAVDWTLAYIGTDLDGDEYFDLDDLVEPDLVFSISKSM
ncbi:TorF family putative porin [Parahaliea mediterranea]|uniref:TorF family putative porin n=1 Tax=Parahaliea mediterranea TaxID=651086 RepID=UPI001300398B|nr:TorF family putative porin [Parahaliea mediterranea]